MMIPKTPHRRRWGWLLAWTLLVFAGGVVAGPTLTDHAVRLVERTCSMVGISAPHFVTNLQRTAPSATSGPASLGAPAPSPQPPAEVSPTGEDNAAKPVAAPVVKSAEPEQAAVAVVPQSPPPPSTEAAAAEPTEVAAADKPVAHPSHAKNEVKAPPAKAAPAKTSAATHASREAAGSDNPFEERAERRSEPKAAAAIRKPKPAFDEPAAKPAASASHDSLDSLMADGTADNKDKKRGSKTIDALLKDVQKTEAEPTKHEAAPAAPPLSQADISRVMAAVKTRGKDCAQRLGQAGVVDLKIVVGKDGSVANANVGGKLANTPLAACIEKVMRASSFPRSTGLRFDYRLDVR
jgi:outer membrane biosynthesis protein TonB